ncbi:hypothetical protein C1Y40_03260 [Mycobacterium talmoniae]|uniref:Flotillin C-terminal domain-containing protein n=1 Tax=Mycobacterium talmoniae TaxID=1858794 RepID=A0A2S8BIY0_9MYCO|nr:hypothetical protein C1Y40_03260 [Mycobacterium talmoniae]
MEQRRAEQAQAALQADVIAPAEAQRQADIARAEGQRQSAILTAQAQAEAARQSGEAQADARKAAADAVRVERQAEADGARASLVAEAEGTKARLIAEAEGTKAKLLAEAEGKKKIAEALNSYSAEAARMLMLPDVLSSVVEATQAAASPLSEIERLSIIGGAGDTRDALGGLLGISPLSLAKVLETLKASGIDVAAMLNRSPNSEQPAAPAAEVVTTNDHPVPTVE